MRVRSIDIGFLVATLGSVSLGGCGGGDSAFAGGATDGTSTAAADDSDNPQASDGLDDTGGGSTGATPEDSSGDDDGTGSQGATCDADCGEGGWCELDEQGTPECLCDPGYAAYGLRCLPCAPSKGLFDVDIPLVGVSGTFLLDGQPFPQSAYERGNILLRDPVSGDEVRLGNTSQGGTDGEVAVLPGSYEVYYAWEIGGQKVPTNRGARIATVSIPHTDSYDLIVDVPVTEISGNFTMGGGQVPGSQYENGAVVLVETSTGDEIPLGDTRDGDYRTMAVPGTYAIHYRRKQAKDLAPINANARIGELVVEEGVDGIDIDIDVPVTTLSGSFTLDGAQPPQSIYENARIVLRDRSTGDKLVLGQTREGSYSVPVVPGSYQVIYQRVQGGLEVPVNQSAVLDELQIEPGAQTLDVEIATAVVTGSISVGGAPPPSDPGNDGLLLLRNPSTGDEARLGNTALGSYSRRVIQGSYDVYYRQETSGGGVPVNTNARLQAVDIQGGASFDIDVPMVTVSALVTVGGQEPPSSVYDDGVLYLRDQATGDSVLLGNTRLAQLERPVVPGTYDLLYVVEAAGPTMPINSHSQLDTIVVGPATQIDVDIPVSVLQGAVTVDDGAPPQSVYNRAVLLLHDIATHDVLYLGTSEAGAFARTITAGTYVLVYQALSSTGLVPANTNAGLACVELLAP